MALTATTRRFSFRSVHSLNTGAHQEKVHGHQYFLEVSFKDIAHADLAAKVEQTVLSRLHGHDLTEFAGPATGEILVEWIHERLSEVLPTQILAVALQETRKNRFVSARSDRRWI